LKHTILSRLNSLSLNSKNAFHFCYKPETLRLATFVSSMRPIKIILSHITQHADSPGFSLKVCSAQRVTGFLFSWSLFMKFYRVCNNQISKGSIFFLLDTYLLDNRVSPGRSHLEFFNSKIICDFSNTKKSMPTNYPKRIVDVLVSYKLLYSRKRVCICTWNGRATFTATFDINLLLMSIPHCGKSFAQSVPYDLSS